MLATDIRDEYFKVWNPYVEGHAEEEAYSWDRWSEWMMHGLILDKA